MLLVEGDGGTVDRLVGGHLLAGVLLLLVCWLLSLDRWIWPLLVDELLDQLFHWREWLACLLGLDVGLHEDLRVDTWWQQSLLR